MLCPQCKEPNFITKQYESVEIDQCKTCHGIWLDKGEIKKIIKDRSTKFSQEDIKSTLKLSFPGIPKPETQKKRLCPKCGDRLNTINYAADTGVIIDTCPSEDGIWLDQYEIEKIQQHREYWSDSIQKNEQGILKLVENIEGSSDAPSRSILYNIASFIGEKLT